MKLDKVDVAMTVPIVISITPDELFLLNKKKGSQYDVQKFIGLIELYDSTLSNQLKTMKKKRITRPVNPGPEIPDAPLLTFKKYITDFLLASKENRKYNVDILREDIKAKEDLYQIYIDQTTESPKLIISIFKASLLK